MIKLTPPMGWNSWNTFGKEITQEVVFETADAMVSTGLKDCGYDYLVIDDCWSLRERDKDGRLVPDPEKFPNGMKAVSDYVHSKGLKLGMYSCAGTLTCAGYPGSFEHEIIDAQTFEQWGVDFLKYDYCFHPKTVPGYVMYKRMGMALGNCGRDILFSACSWGTDDTREWAKSTGANMWRTTGDLFDSWESLKQLSMLAPKSTRFSAINSFADMDMLIVGMHGKGNVGLSGCTDEEYKINFAMWALLGSPLMIGCDIRNMDKATSEILMNKDIIALNQDPEYNQAFPLNFKYDAEHEEEIHVYARVLSGGDIAIGLFNFTDSKHKPCIELDLLGMPESTGKTLELTELYTGEKVTVKNGIYPCLVNSHSCKIFRGKVVDKQ